MDGNTHFCEITFEWDRGRSELTLRDLPYAEALEIAKSRGFREWCWYRPSTWGNLCYGLSVRKSVL